MRQVLDRHQSERKEERVDPIRIEERGGERGKTEHRPRARGDETRSDRRLRHRLECERSDQDKAENEPAMHVHPCSHERSEPKRRRAAAITRRDKRCAPDSRERERQQMRPREQVRGQERKADRDGRDERRAPKFTRGAQSDDQRCKRGGRASQQHDSAPSAEAKGKRQQSFRQPFVCCPRLSRHRMAEWIDVRRAPMSDDPRSRRHVRPRIAVTKHSGRERSEHEEKE